MTSTSRKTLVRLGAIALLALPLAACSTDSVNRGVDSVHQPVVSYASYTFDVQAGGARQARSGHAAIGDEGADGIDKRGRHKHSFPDRG